MANELTSVLILLIISHAQTGCSKINVHALEIVGHPLPVGINTSPGHCSVVDIVLYIYYQIETTIG